MLNKLKHLGKYLLDKLPELLPLSWAPLIAVLALWENYLLQEFDLYIPPVWQLRLLELLLALTLILGTYIFLNRSKYTEYRGAYFKPKKCGGYHEVVYCGSCKSPTAIHSRAQFLDLQFTCKCGWVSSFNLGEFNAFYPTL